MKVLLSTLALVFSMSTFAALETVTCKVEDQTIKVKVGPKGGKITIKERFSDAQVKISIDVMYNGISDNLEIGASGRYTVGIVAKKIDSVDGSVTNLASVRNFATTFPFTSGLFLFRNNESHSVNEGISIEVSCY